MNKRFDEIFEEVLDIEKGYSDNEYDPGGKTRYGITEQVARKYGYEGDMRELPLLLAKEIAYKRFYKPHKYHEINNKEIAAEMFEQGYNMGNYQANIHLQKAYNMVSDDDIVVDGIIGNKTLKAVNERANVDRLFNMLNAIQVHFYFELYEKDDKYKHFINGWINKRIIIRSI